MALNRRQFLRTAVSAAAGVAGAACVVAGPLAPRAVGQPAQSAVVPAAPRPTARRHWRDAQFIMDNWYSKSNLKIEEQIKLTKDLGYTGMTWSLGAPEQWHEFARVLEMMDKNGLALTGVSTGVFIHNDPFAKKLHEFIGSLEGRDAYVMPQLRSREDKRSAKTGDARAVDVLKQMSDDCHKAGILGVAMYPAQGNWLELVGHGVRLAQQVQRDNVGTMFNQYHWMLRERKVGLERTLKPALPHLYCVTINGSDDKTPSILPLGQGSFDTREIVKMLADNGYAGEIGTMGFGINGDVPGKLRAALDAWNKIKASL